MSVASDIANDMLNYGVNLGKESEVKSRTDRGTYKVMGGKILVFSDIHLSATYSGKHKNYQYECYYTMQRILDIVSREKPSAVIFLGDIVGVRETNIKDHQFLMRVVMFFGSLYNATKGNVYTVKGNHDAGNFTDFDFLTGLGYLKNPNYVDYYGSNELEIRFHFVNYGEENEILDIVKEGGTNIVLGHADYYIDGVTTWYSDKLNRIELKSLSNFNGVKLVVSGHIHIPSEEVLSTSLPDGESVDLFYPGSPSRVAERYDDCWYMCFEYQGDSTNYNAEYFGLQKASEVFYDEQAYEYENDLGIEEVDDKTSESLSRIVTEILESRLATGDILSQVDKIPADENSKKIAKDYLRKAIDGGK